MTQHPLVLVVQNTNGGGVRRLGDWLREDGLELDVVEAFDGTPLPDQLHHDAMVVLGGGYLPDEDERASWLPQTRALATQALAQNRPFLGICLGGQLLAHVAGGTVTGKTGHPEHGSTPIRLRAEAGSDTLFHDLPERVHAIEHHVDAVTALPDSAVWLASSDQCPYQAFRIGEHAWGVQFHPEMSADRILEWNAEKLRQQGIDRAQLHESALSNEAESAVHWRSLAHRFANVVHQR